MSSSPFSDRQLVEDIIIIETTADTDNIFAVLVELASSERAILLGRS